jgi:flagellar basal-body rod protein FlgF
MGWVDSASLMISNAMQRVEISAHNVANITTPGFKAYSGVGFQRLVDAAAAMSPANRSLTVNFADGKLQNTGNPLDLAISGDGFFVVRSSAGTFYTRNGQFRRDADGNLVLGDGLVLQSNTGDVNLQSSNIRVLLDGTVLDNGEAVSHIAVARFDDVSSLEPIGGGLFRAASGSTMSGEDARIEQGMLETSNVSTADEMLTIMSAMRSAECGQHLVQAYDDLMGRVITAFGQY